MPTLPTLHTERLTLRPFSPADAPTVRELAGAREVAATTLRIPHPYPEGAAEAWIASHQDAFDRGASADFAITRTDTGELVGAIGLTLNKAHQHGEIGYWIGVPHWHNGYVTEAARAVLAYGFGPLDLARIHAHHFAENAASGRVMQKLGMTYEGTLRRHIEKWGRWHDLPMYGILAEEFDPQRAAKSVRATTAPAPRFDAPVPRPIVLPRIETARLLLRALSIDDASALANVCDDEIYARANGGIDLPYTADKALRSIETGIRRAEEGGAAAFAITLKDSGELIGRMAVSAIRPQHRRGNLSLLIARSHWEKRYASEALRALIDYAFKGLHLNRLDAYCFTWNAASIRLIERCGLKREGFRRQSDYVDGEWYDDLLYGLTRGEYDADRMLAGETPD